MKKGKLTYRIPAYASETDSTHPPYHPIRGWSLLVYFILIPVAVMIHLVTLELISAVTLWFHSAILMSACIFCGTYINEGWLRDGKPVPFRWLQLVAMALFVIATAGCVQAGLTGGISRFFSVAMIAFVGLSMFHVIYGMNIRAITFSRPPKFNIVKKADGQ